MSNRPSDEDVRRAARAQQDAKETAKAMAPFVEANRLNPLLLKRTLDQFASHADDAGEDGVFAQRWLDADTFYRHTEEYVPVEHRGAYKHALDAAFPKKKVSP